MYYKRFLVKEADHFKPDNFPQLAGDIETLGTAISQVKGGYKTEILLSYLRKRVVHEEWNHVNPVMVGMINSKQLPVSGIEALYDSSDGTELFQKELEAYIIELCGRANAAQANGV
jgi:hypothetical protein